MPLTGRQIAAARTLLGINQPELAARAKVSVATLKRMEGSPREASGLTNNVDAVQRALEAAGVIFIETNGEGPGVRLRRPIGKTAKTTLKRRSTHYHET